VFCIDDDEATLEVLKSTVETHGYSVLTCSNWQSAMDIFKRNTIDLVIVDYEMPPMSGYEVSLWIRSVSPRVPIILHSDSLDTSEIAIKRADACIPKGTEPSVLIAAISTLIMKSREPGGMRGEE
jgi:two-component system autoinducer 1 sensor kinase/phosphatase LuxN